MPDTCVLVSFRGEKRLFPTTKRIMSRQERLRQRINVLHSPARLKSQACQDRCEPSYQARRQAYSTAAAKSLCFYQNPLALPTALLPGPRAFVNGGAQ